MSNYFVARPFKVTGQSYEEGTTAEIDDAVAEQYVREGFLNPVDAAPAADPSSDPAPEASPAPEAAPDPVADPAPVPEETNVSPADGTDGSGSDAAPSDPAADPLAPADPSSDPAAPGSDAQAKEGE